MVQAYSTMNRFLARFLEHVGVISFYDHRKKYVRVSGLYIGCIDSLFHLRFIVIGTS